MADNSNNASKAPQEREMHKSMIDDVERPGAPANGRFESNPDEKEGHYDPKEAENKKDNTQQQTSTSNASDATKNAGTTGDTDRKPAGGMETGGTANPQSGAEIQQGQNQNPMSNSNEPNQGFGGAGAQPSVGAAPTGDQPQGSQQGSGNPTSDPDQQQQQSTDKSGTDQQQQQSTNKSGTDADKGGDSKPKPLGGGGAAGGGGMKMGDGPDLPEDKSEEKGTGEKYEKSTGMAADGGDFDATRPGAAKEADRLMEEKGITHGESKPEMPDEEKKGFSVDHSGFGGHGSHQNKPRNSSKDETAEKSHEEKAQEKTVPGSDPSKSFVDKIKDKLHHNKSDA